MKKKKSCWKSIAIITTIVGAIVAAASFIKRKSQKLSDELDFDNSQYFDDLPDQEEVEESGIAEAQPVESEETQEEEEGEADPEEETEEKSE